MLIGHSSAQKRSAKAYLPDPLALNPLIAINC